MQNVGSVLLLLGAFFLIVWGYDTGAYLTGSLIGRRRMLDHISPSKTVEGLAANGDLNALQQAFADAHGLHCGYCTPGFLMLATALLRENPDTTDEEIRAAMSANLCRCTGYAGILAAVRAAADAETS